MTFKLSGGSFSITKYLDQTDGKTADELVAFALANNGELEAVRQEVKAAEALIDQANLRANPMLEIGAAKNPATPSRSVMVKGSLPLELYGRRGARVRVAERETEVRRQVLTDRERILAAEVRSKFGETFARFKTAICRRNSGGGNGKLCSGHCPR